LNRAIADVRWRSIANPGPIGDTRSIGNSRSIAYAGPVTDSRAIANAWSDWNRGKRSWSCSNTAPDSGTITNAGAIADAGTIVDPASRSSCRKIAD
jgi:hypothetical protein